MLDTHALFWLVSGENALSDEALVEIGFAQAAGNLYVSPITAWELSVAAQKPRAAARPQLGTDSADKWFKEAVRVIAAKVVPIHQKIALEAARVVTATGHKDPGDCYLIGTARTRGIPIVTRDFTIREIAANHPGYLSVILC